MNLRTLAWLAALVPIVAGHGAYLISASVGEVPWCVPYVDGCTSISRAARHGPANPLFRAIMLPYAAVLALFWWRAARWLATVAPARRRLPRAVLGCGGVGALFLVLYAAFLGVDGEIYQWLRRYGITFYFAGTVVAQMLVVSALAREPRVAMLDRRLMVSLCGVLLGLGLASIPLQHFVADADAALDALEWWYALLMTLFFPLIGRAARG